MGDRHTRTHLPAAAVAHDGDDVARDASPAAPELDAPAHSRVQLRALAVPPPLQEASRPRLQHAGGHSLRFQAPLACDELLDNRDQIRRVVRLAQAGARSRVHRVRRRCAQLTSVPMRQRHQPLCARPLRQAHGSVEPRLRLLQLVLGRGKCGLRRA